MDDRPDIPAVAPAGADAPAVLVAHPAGHAVALAVIDRLNTAGYDVIALPSIYDAVIRLAREPRRYAAAVLAVDFFNRDELHVFPMAARRWPALPVAAVAQPAFAYKASIADLLGARAVCSDPADAGEFLRRLDLDEPRAPRTITVTIAVPPMPPPEPASLSPAAAEVTFEPRSNKTALPVSGLPTVEVTPPAATPRPLEVEIAVEPTGEDEFAAEVREIDGETPADDTTDMPKPPAAETGTIRIPQAELPTPVRRPPAARNNAPLAAAHDVLTEEELSALMADLNDDEAIDERD